VGAQHDAALECSQIQSALENIHTKSYVKLNAKINK
jgi:hypothetical protein